ncbi:substrate-binding domain-containing protein [Glycomyces tarimensis]
MTTSERWVIEGEYLRDHFEDLGYRTLLEYAENEAETQVDQIQGMIDAGVEFLIISAVDNRSLGAVLADAKDNGVTIIAYDRLILQTPDVDYYASFDNYQVGVLQAEHIISRLGLEDDPDAGPFNVELFSGDPADSNSEYFFLGGLDTLERYTYEGRVQIVSEQTEQQETSTAGWDGEIAKERMAKLLDDYYSDDEVELHAVLSPYDGISRGIVEALVDADYTPGSDDFPIVTGQDAEAASVKAIRDETGQTQTVFKDTRNLADVALNMVTAIMDGGSPEVNDLGTYNNGFKFVPAYLLEPVAVDQSNWEEVLIESDYLTMEDVDEA